MRLDPVMARNGSGERCSVAQLGDGPRDISGAKSTIRRTGLLPVDPYNDFLSAGFEDYPSSRTLAFSSARLDTPE
jgi:hypothetical protein